MQRPLPGFAWDDEPPRDEVVADLRPFFPSFGEIITQANAQYFTDVAADTRAFLLGRTRANIISDGVRRQLLSRFDGHEVVRPCERLGFLKLFVGDRLVVRFKKLNRMHLPANVRTRQQRDWYADRSLPHVADRLTRLTVGYTLDALQLNVASLLVVRTHGWRALLWEFDFTDFASGSTVPATEAATTDVQPIEFTIRDSARLDVDVDAADVSDERNRRDRGQGRR